MGVGCLIAICLLGTVIGLVIGKSMAVWFEHSVDEADSDYGGITPFLLHSMRNENDY